MATKGAALGPRGDYLQKMASFSADSADNGRAKGGLSYKRDIVFLLCIASQFISYQQHFHEQTFLSCVKSHLMYSVVQVTMNMTIMSPKLRASALSVRGLSVLSGVTRWKRRC